MQYITLAEGITAPALGYGTYLIDPAITERCARGARGRLPAHRHRRPVPQ
ncbi:hypothetical protein [uncultured Actinomyces sp.]|nr:hypothetical protein [uncultured Actinomyces sp.]